MLAALVAALRSLALICGGHRAVAIENLALRQQSAVFKRTVRRPQLRHRDRLFWMLLDKAWRDWRTALIVVLLTPLCVGIANGSAASGRVAQRGAVWAATVRMRPFVRS